MNQESLLSLGRLTHMARLVLVGLEGRPMRGGELIRFLKEVHNTWLEPGTLGTVLRRLEREGWISPLDRDESGRRIPLYSATDAGLKVLYKETSFLFEQGERIRGPVFQGIFQWGMLIALKWILRLYPKGWRERYEEEMIALLETHDITLWTWLDLLFNAFLTRLDPFYRRPAPPVSIQLLKRWRTAIIVAISAVPVSVFFYTFFIDERGDSAWIWLNDNPIIAFLRTISDLSTLAVLTCIGCASLLLAYKYVGRENVPDNKYPYLFPLLGMSALAVVLTATYLFLDFKSPLSVILSATVMFIIGGLTSIPLIYQYTQRHNKRKFGFLHLLPLFGLCTFSFALFLGTVAIGDAPPGEAQSPMGIIAMLLLLGSMVFTVITLIIALFRLNLDRDKHLLAPLLFLATLITGAMLLGHVSMLMQQAVTSFIWPGGNWSADLIIGLLTTIFPTLIALFLLLRVRKQEQPPAEVPAEQMMMPYQRQG